MINQTAVLFGRREQDRVISAMLAESLLQGKKAAPIINERATPEKIRRPRRTKAQLANAFKLARANVSAAHPEWSPARAKRAAKRLVETYQVVG